VDFFILALSKKSALKMYIEESIAKSPSPRITDYFSQGFNIFFKKPWLFVGFILIFFGINFGLSIIPFGGLVFSIFFQPLLMIGLYVVADRINYQEEVEFSYFFDGFRGDIGKVIVANLLMFLMFLVPLALLFGGFVSVLGLDNLIAAASQKPEDVDIESIANFSAGAGIMIFIGVLLIMYLGFSYTFVLHMVRFKNLSGWQALEASRKLVGKHFLSIFLFAFLGAIINLAGILLLVVGLLVTIPASLIATYVAFDDLVKARDTEAEDEIMDHFISE
jgi:hypothetical protein